MMLKKFDLARIYHVEFKSRIYTCTSIQHYNIKHLRMYFENIYMAGKSHITVKKISVEKMSINPYSEKLCGVNNFLSNFGPQSPSEFYSSRRNNPDQSSSTASAWSSPRNIP